MNPLLHALQACGETFHDLSFTVVDMTMDDQPLVYVNQHFIDMTGHHKEEIMHKNCRFLQGPTNQPDVRSQLRHTLKQGKACFQDLLNYRRDGSPFWNRLCLFPIHHDVLGIKYYVGIQLDVTEQREQRLGNRVADFINNPERADNLYQEISNPLEEILSKTRSLKYFAQTDSDSMAQRQGIVQSIASAVRQLTERVTQLEA